MCVQGFDSHQYHRQCPSAFLNYKTNLTHRAAGRKRPKMEKVNVKPLLELLEENVDPHHLASLLDELMFNHMSVLLRMQFFSREDGIPQNTEEILFFVKMLRDSLMECCK